MEEADVVIVGAGPAGSALACLLAAAGIPTLLLDRSTAPAFKVGESLLPEGILLLREMGLGPALERKGFLRKDAARFVLSDDGAEDRFVFGEARRGQRAPFAYQVKRVDFDGMLQEEASARGARLLRGFEVAELELEAHGGVEARASDGRRARGRFLVDASGPARLLARRAGRVEPIRGLGKLALFSHFEGIPRDDGPPGGDIVVLWNRSGWFWLIPFSDGTTSVGVVGDPELLRAAGPDDGSRFARLCDQSETHRRWLGDRRQLRPLERRSDFSYRCPTLTGPRFLLVGDAAGFIDPIFSTGVFLAQVGASLAAEALIPALTGGHLPGREGLGRYEAALRTGTDRFLALVRQFYDHRFVTEIVRARRRSEIKRAITSLLAGDVYDEDNPLLRMGLLAPRSAAPA